MRKWLTLNYTLPREASKAGVTLWRKLKKSGAVCLDQTDWILPATKVNRAVFVELSEDILKYGGEAHLVDWVPSDGESTERIIAAFEDARNEDYLELIQHTIELIDELDHEMENENFSSATLEKKESRLQKLTHRFVQIKQQDFRKAPLCEDANDTLKDANDTLEDCRSRISDYRNWLYHLTEGNSQVNIHDY